MLELQSALLDLEEDLERLAWGLKAAEAVSETLAPSSSYGEGLYAVCDYLFEAEKNMRRDLDRCLERIRGKQGEKLQKTRRLACNPIPSIVK